MNIPTFPTGVTYKVTSVKKLKNGSRIIKFEKYETEN